MLGNKKSVCVMGEKLFVAAFSEFPFAESRKKAQFPNYSFCKSNGLYWCVRVGDINIPFGFGASEAGFAANGKIIISRRNVTPESFDGKGFEFIKQGDISYLYECQVINDTFEGFAIHLRNRLMPHILDIAKVCQYDPVIFADEIKKISKISAVQNLFNEHKIILKDISVKIII